MTALRHDKKGRSTNLPASSRVREHIKPDGPFSFHTLELLESMAFRVMSLTARRALDRIEVEHLRQGRTENGNLAISQRQFIDYGLTGDSVSPAIRELEALGLIAITTQGTRSKNGPTGRATTFRLTFIGTTDAPPSHDWRKHHRTTDYPDMDSLKEASMKLKSVVDTARECDPRRSYGQPQKESDAFGSGVVAA